MTVWNVWTDGSCMHGVANVQKGVLGWGGWAAIVEHGSDGLVLRGREERTTNVRMELVAAVEGLRAIPEGASVVVFTDCTTLLCVAQAKAEQRMAGFSGADAKLWKALAAELDARKVQVRLLGKGPRDPIHKRAHVIAGAEARGGLRNLPLNAAPLDDSDAHRIRKGMRRRKTQAWINDPRRGRTRCGW